MASRTMDHKIINYVLTVANPGNYIEAITLTCRKFPECSVEHIMEVVSEVYYLKKWRKDRYIPSYERQLRADKRIDFLEGYE